MGQKVSIIIPIYNVFPFLNQAIKSACNQTYQDIEVILVDDGSDDGSSELCDKWAKKDSRVIVVHKKNGGLSDARNAGLKLATGEYILFLDGDDYIHKSLVEIAVNSIDQNYDMVVFKYLKVFPNGRTSKGIYNSGEYKLDTFGEKASFYINILLNYGIGWEACTRMYRHDVIKRNHLSFENNSKIFAEDMCFNICYCLDISSILCLDKVMYYYRYREDSIMGKNAVKLNSNRMNELSKSVYRYFIKHRANKEIMDVFPVIHYLIITNSVLSYKNAYGLNEVQFRKILIDDIVDKHYFFFMLNKLYKDRDKWSKYVSGFDKKHIIRTSEYWRKGNLIKFLMKTALYRGVDLLSEKL